MLIAGLSLKVPSRRVSNYDIVDWVRQTASAAGARIDADLYCQHLARMLARSGAENRYVRDRTRNETAIALMTDAARSALDEAGILAKDIDLVIFCGVCRGFLEPSNAAFLCRSLGMSCANFDVGEACMSWVRSLQVAYSFLSSGLYSRILIVNGEFGTLEYDVASTGLHTDSDLRHTFASYTIGEAASAVVLVRSERRWSFRFKADPSRASLCTLPLRGYADFSEPDERLGLNGVDSFVCFGQELMHSGLELMAQLVDEAYGAAPNFGLCFPHAVSLPSLHLAAARFGLGDALYKEVFPRLGNVASASIPAALSYAIDERLLTRGDHMVLCPISAGVSVALVEAIY